MEDDNDNVIENVLFVHKDDEKVYFEDFFLNNALDFIKFSINNVNTYHVCNCHLEHEGDKILFIEDIENLTEELINHDSEFKLDNIMIHKSPHITHDVNGDVVLNLNVFCDICGTSIYINLDIFNEALERYRQIIEESIIEDMYIDAENVVRIPQNHNPKVTQDKLAEIINFKSKTE